MGHGDVPQIVMYAVARGGKGEHQYPSRLPPQKAPGLLAKPDGDDDECLEDLGESYSDRSQISRPRQCPAVTSNHDECGVLHHDDEQRAPASTALGHARRPVACRVCCFSVRPCRILSRTPTSK
eukprot:scaffold273920_cov30-Tisochrysis_lutea.AAC.1